MAEPVSSPYNNCCGSKTEHRPKEGQVLLDPGMGMALVHVKTISQNNSENSVTGFNDRIQPFAQVFNKVVHPSQVREIFPRFLALFRKTAPDKDAFLTPEREQFFLSVAEEFSRRAWLEFFVLSFDKKEVAYLLSFHYNDTLYLYNAAYDPDYSSISPGIVAITYCLEDTISRGIKCFDFLRGDETYKYRFGARDNHLYRLTVHLLGEKKTCIA